jgi:hypothetical protein
MIVKPDQVTILAETQAPRIAAPTTNSPKMFYDVQLGVMTSRDETYSDNEFDASTNAGPASSSAKGLMFDPRLVRPVSAFSGASPVDEPSSSNAPQVNALLKLQPYDDKYASLNVARRSASRHLIFTGERPTMFHEHASTVSPRTSSGLSINGNPTPDVPNVPPMLAVITMLILGIAQAQSAIRSRG